MPALGLSWIISKEIISLVAVVDSNPMFLPFLGLGFYLLRGTLGLDLLLESAPSVCSALFLLSVGG